VSDRTAVSQLAQQRADRQAPEPAPTRIRRRRLTAARPAPLRTGLSTPSRATETFHARRKRAIASVRGRTMVAAERHAIVVRSLEHSRSLSPKLEQASIVQSLTKRHRRDLAHPMWCAPLTALATGDRTTVAQQRAGLERNHEFTLLTDLRPAQVLPAQPLLAMRRRDPATLAWIAPLTAREVILILLVVRRVPMEHRKAHILSRGPGPAQVTPAQLLMAMRRRDPATLAWIAPLTAREVILILLVVQLVQMEHRKAHILSRGPGPARVLIVRLSMAMSRRLRAITMYRVKDRRQNPLIVQCHWRSGPSAQSSAVAPASRRRRQ
jgi:hypothetical protein